MMEIEIVVLQEDQRHHHHKTVDVHVRYIAARKHFVEQHAPWHETLKALKPRVLKFFELVEGPVDGGTKIYNFSLNGEIVSNLDETLGCLVEKLHHDHEHHEHHELKLDLIEHFEQGC